MLVEEFGAQSIMQWQPNPYAGLVPHRMADPISAGGDRLWYTNQFIGVFQGREIMMSSVGSVNNGDKVRLLRKTPSQHPIPTTPVCWCPIAG